MASLDSDVHARDVLRYWLASIRLEESLRVRPRARRPRPGPSVPRLLQPAAGQEYFKLVQTDLQRVLTSDGLVTRAFDPELASFFEAWLLQRYRRGEDDGELAHVLCFPVVHLPRGELAGLLRRGVKLRFERADASFRVPTRSERQRGALPEPPDRVVIAITPRQDDAWPFFIDTRLLSHPLGVSSERIDALFDRLRERSSWSEHDMLTLIASQLEEAAREASDAFAARGSEPLERLMHAMQHLLRCAPARADLYPLGIVVDGTQAKTTWHLQREIAALLADREGLDGVLGAYLAGGLSPRGEASQRALYVGPSLTAHQRDAAEAFWGSHLSAVRGPPGTGKTTLVLHLCAEAIVRQVEALLVGHTMGSQITLITSSNNRAVDNVVEPLSTLRALPLALRVGSRQVCEQVLAPQLHEVARWLSSAQAEPEPLRKSAYAHALTEFADVRERIARLHAPQETLRERKAARRRIAQALASLPPSDTPSTRLGEHARLLEAPLGKLVQRLEALSELCNGKPTMAHVNAVARHWDKTAARELTALETALRAAGIQVDVPLPPLETPLGVAALMDAWEDGAEGFLEKLARLRAEVAASLEAERLHQRRTELERQLAELGPEEPAPTVAQDDALSRALFEAALTVRECWAKVHAETLRDVVAEAAQLAAQERSLRPLFRDAPARARWLCQLFGVWGSTLLSLGNCLPAEEGLVASVVIDEAGQCHPAHAVSALLRTPRALILGDVHQLPPVIDVTPDDDARLVRVMRPKLDARRLAPYRVHSESHTSAQALADRAVAERLTLIDHYRCQPAIIAVSDALCGYGLRTYPRARDAASRASLLPHAVCIRDLRGEQQRHAGSLCNELELEQTVQLVQTLLARGVVAADIAVITPYRGQLVRLLQVLRERQVPLAPHTELPLFDGESSVPALEGIALGTVHRFQGGERSIVLFSSVVTQVRSLPFMNERPNLLNVAISRAQQHFVCLGDSETLRRGAITRLLVEAAKPF